MASIHATAIVSSEAQLGENVTIGAYSVVESGVTIGNDTEIGPHCVVRSNTTIGERNHIYQFCSVGEDPQDKKYAGEQTYLEIGNGNTIREFCTLNRGTSQDEGVTRLGDNNWIMAYVHIAHDCVVGNETIFANNVTLAGHVTVEDYVIWGGFSGAHQFARVGAHAFVGNNAGVAKDVPPYLMVFGQPCVPRGLNLEGLKRRGFSKDQVRNIKEAYRLLYQRGLQLEEAREKIVELAVGNPEIEIFSDFIKPSDRGLVR